MIAAFTISSGTALAEEPITEDSASDLLAQLERADDPRQAFGNLNDAQQAQVIEALTPVSTEVIDYTTVQASQSSNQVCSTHWAGINAKNLAGVILWEYETKTVWCRDTEEELFTRDPIFTQYEDTHLLWEFVGHVSIDEDGGEGDTMHWDFANGHFRLCISPGGIGCAVHEYPWVSKRQYASGIIWDDVGT